ncbi:unnamed protein product [Rotaria sp. Silwood2]|nr:unnamed protein product [Rotaria sp. Silwood2]
MLNSKFPKDVNINLSRLINVLGEGHFGKFIMYGILVRDEVELINLSEHIFFIKLYPYFHTDDHIIFVMEYLCNGDLMTHIHEDDFSEQRSCFYIACFILNLEFLYSNKIIYRGLKLDNLL